MATGVVQMDEQGRRYFATLHAAMEALPVPVEVRGQVLRLGIGEFDRVWIPAGREYVALAEDGQNVAWYVNRTFADRYVGPKQYARTEFSNFVGRAGGAKGAAVAAQHAAVCPVHHIQLPASGVCDECA